MWPLLLLLQSIVLQTESLWIPHEDLLLKMHQKGLFHSINFVSQDIRAQKT